MRQESNYYTANDTEAHAIYIDDYCLTMAITAGMHSGGFDDGYDPHSALRRGYRAIIKSSRYVYAQRPLCLFMFKESPESYVSVAVGIKRAMGWIMFSSHPIR